MSVRRPLGNSVSHPNPTHKHQVREVSCPLATVTPWASPRWSLGRGDILVETGLNLPNRLAAGQENEHIESLIKQVCWKLFYWLKKYIFKKIRNLLFAT